MSFSNILTLTKNTDQILTNFPKKSVLQTKSIFTDRIVITDNRSSFDPQDKNDSLVRASNKSARKSLESYEIKDIAKRLYLLAQ